MASTAELNGHEVLAVMVHGICPLVEKARGDMHDNLFETLKNRS